MFGRRSSSSSSSIYIQGSSESLHLAWNRRCCCSSHTSSADAPPSDALSAAAPLDAQSAPYSSLQEVAQDLCCNSSMACRRKTSAKTPHSLMLAVWIATVGKEGRHEHLKRQVNRCLIRLSDKDIEAMATSEMELLCTDELPVFLAAVSNMPPSVCGAPDSSTLCSHPRCRPSRRILARALTESSGEGRGAVEPLGAGRAVPCSGLLDEQPPELLPRPLLRRRRGDRGEAAVDGSRGNPSSSWAAVEEAGTRRLRLRAAPLCHRWESSPEKRREGGRIGGRATVWRREMGEEWSAGGLGEKDRDIGVGWRSRRLALSRTSFFADVAIFCAPRFVPKIQW